jgi:hypothetical protein
MAACPTNFSNPEGVTNPDGFFAGTGASVGAATETLWKALGSRAVNAFPLVPRTLAETVFMQRSGTRSNDGTHSHGERAVSNLLFFRRSYAYRNAAADMMRKARAMPPGSERRAARQLARALRDLANTEAWLEGQTPHLRPATYGREHKRSAVC